MACCPFRVTARPRRGRAFRQGAQLKGVRRPSGTPHAPLDPDPSLRLADPAGPGRSEPLRPDLPRTPRWCHDHGQGLRHRGPSRHHAAPKVAHLFQMARAKAYRNIPCSEADEASIDEIKVLDPRHPLYGRSFRVLRRSTHRGGNFPPSYEAEYRNGSSLLIPVAVTEWHDSPNDQLKLCLEALRDLVHAVDCLDSHDEHKTKRSLDDTVAGSEAASGRPPRRCPGGGRS